MAISEVSTTDVANQSITTTSTSSTAKLSVGILGATGIVGQRLISLLENHPYFRADVLGASSSSVGLKFGKCVNWCLEKKMPKEVKDIEIVPCRAENFLNCSWVFSALDSSVALSIEKEFQEANLLIFTNSAAYRMDSDVPLIVPSVNGAKLFWTLGHLTTTKIGLIIANTNCTTSGIAVVLEALKQSKLVPEAVMVHSLQAISGAGISPGISSMSIHDNVIPYIANEEEKIQEELCKILMLDDLKVSASCNRVMVSDGHTVNLAIKFDSQSVVVHDKSKLVDMVKESLKDFSPLKMMKACPSCPKNAIFVFEDELDRPQPKLDRMRDSGMCVSVGRIRECSIMDIKLTLVVNNTILGAAGSALLNAEIAYQAKYIS